MGMLTIDIGPMIDRGLLDNCGPILACYIGPKIAPNDRPRITARVKSMTFQIYNDINNDMLKVVSFSLKNITTNQLIL